MPEKFIFGTDTANTKIAEGVLRKVLAHAPNLMLVEMTFSAGATGAAHTHPHEQATYILSGRFRFTNAGETREVGPGDSLYFAPGAEHGTVCLQDGQLLDVFTPCREDFL